MRRFRFRHLADGEISEAEVVAASLNEWDESKWSDDTGFSIARYRAAGKDHVIALKVPDMPCKPLSPKPIAISNNHHDSRGRKWSVTTHIIPADLWPSLWPGYPKPEWAVTTDPASGAKVCSRMEGPIVEPKPEGEAKPKRKRKAD